MIMLASLATRLFDIDGDQLLELEGDSDITKVERRIVRTKTLDGALVMSDGGLNQADPVITLTFQVSAAVDTKIRSFAKLHLLLTLATRYGVFLGAIGTYSINSDGIASLRFQPTQELTR